MNKVKKKKKESVLIRKKFYHRGKRYEDKYFQVGKEKALLTKK